MNSIDRPKFFLEKFSIACLIFGLPILVLQALCMSFGELDLDLVVSRQLKNNNILFLSALNQQVFEYKLKLVDEIKPEVVIIGSSLSMQVRESFFKKSFVNLGGMAHSIYGLEYTSKQLIERKYRPSFAFVVLDPWWFNGQYQDFYDEPIVSAKYPNVLSEDMIFQTAKVLSQNDWPMKQILRSSNLGLQSKIKGDGYAADGSFYYLSKISSRSQSKSPDFDDDIATIRNGMRPFHSGEIASASLISRACKALNSMADNNIQVIAIFPPFPGSVDRLINTKKYSYIEDAFNSLGNCLNGVDLENFSSQEKYNLFFSDYEFVDGFHAGDIIYARMLKQIASRNKKLSNYSNDRLIDEFITRYSFEPFGYSRYKFFK